MRISTISASALTLAGFAAGANSTRPLPYSTDGLPPPPAIGSAPDTGSQGFIDANNNPNASNTVFFQHYYQGSVNAALTSNWSWTVKVSDVVAPPNSSVDPPLSSDAHVAYTTYEFSWPDDGDLNEVLQDENNANPNGRYDSCAYIFTALFPSNVSKKFDEGSDSNCTNILGAECVANLTLATSVFDGECRFGGSFYQEACGDSLGVAHGGYGTVSTSQSKGFASYNISAEC